MTSERFVSLALQGFGLGFGLGMLLWGTMYAWKVFRKAFLAGMRIIE